MIGLARLTVAMSEGLIAISRSADSMKRVVDVNVPINFDAAVCRMPKVEITKVVTKVSKRESARRKRMTKDC